MVGGRDDRKPRSVQVKLRLQADADKAQFLEDASRTSGVRRITQTFPDEEDELLSTFYVAEVDPEQVTSTIRSLRRDARIQHVESPAPRKLIR